MSTDRALTVIAPVDGEPFSFGDVRGRFKIGGAATQNRFAIAQLPEIPPRTLAAPLHRHHNEDEYTYVASGTLGVAVGDEVVNAAAGTWLVKPRGQWHTFWNPGHDPCHIIEVVSPAGFEPYFREVAEAGADLDRLVQINAKYGIDMDFDSVPQLCSRFGLHFAPPGS